MLTLSHDLQTCIDECIHCYRTCWSMATGHCLERGGDHVEPEHFRLMLACAETCRTAAQLMLAQAPEHEAQCAVCAEICERCAASCEALGDMAECVDACRRCAEACRAMAQ